MTSLQLNAELLRQLSYIVGDDKLTRKVLDYIKRLRRQSAPATSGALSEPADVRLEREAKELYGLFENDSLTDSDVEQMVNEARREVYGTQE